MFSFHCFSAASLKLLEASSMSHEMPPAIQEFAGCVKPPAISAALLIPIAKDTSSEFASIALTMLFWSDFDSPGTSYPALTQL